MSCCDGNGSIQEIKRPVATSVGTKEVTVSKEASDYILDLMKKEDKVGWGLKIEVMPGGCAGFRYCMAFQKKPLEGEETLEAHGVKFFFDQESFGWIQGSEISYISSLEGSGIKINNPNATRTCGCGKSFG